MIFKDGEEPSTAGANLFSRISCKYEIMTSRLPWRIIRVMITPASSRHMNLVVLIWSQINK